MRRDVLKRLEAMETARGDDGSPRYIAMVIVDSDGEKLPILGWTESMTRDPKSVYREPGESDDALKERAFRAFKASPWRVSDSVPVMHAIIEE